MPAITLRAALCLVTAVLCNVHGSLEHEIPRRSFLSRRAIDGTRGRKYFDPDEEGSLDSYGSAGGQYDPYEQKTDLSAIRKNVPGEPGIDYPAYTILPQTGFTCEGRSRGYYADEVAGCQVFHVCHDVLVSSFLCPLGSIFSQKLLTCDWWTKVDCTSTQKYIDVNRHSYQQDDDEMIRNAYAMISLQSGKDVTRDGLVDPDRTGSIVDYHRGPQRTVDYSNVDGTGNELRNSFDDYPTSNVQEFIPNYKKYREQTETSKSYHDRFFSQDRSPYHDSPIIRIQKIEESRRGKQRKDDYGDDYRRINEFTNKFQPSYAPTVPTVTTTTRRFYSPTVPTTYRPSTLAYNKLDQLVDSSDHFYSRSRTTSFVTPPTRIFPKNEPKVHSVVNSARSNEDSTRKIDEVVDYDHEDTYEDEDSTNFSRAFSDERSEESGERFQVRVADFRSNRTKAVEEEESELDRIYGRFHDGRDEKSIEDIETRGSIGLGHALRKPLRRISIQEQNPVNGGTKSDDRMFRQNDSRYSSTYRDEEADSKYQHTLTKPESFDLLGKSEEETTEQYDRDVQATTTTEYDSREYTVDFDGPTGPSGHQDTTEKVSSDDPDIFVPSTTSTSSFLESTFETTTKNPTFNESSKDALLVEETRNSTERKSLDIEIEPVKRMDVDFTIPKPVEFLKPPEVTLEKFRINVAETLPEVSSHQNRYSTIDDQPFPVVTTTEASRLRGSSEETTGLHGSTFRQSFPTVKPVDSSVTYQTRDRSTQDKLTASTIPWFSSSWKHRSAPNVPVTEIVPPVVHYSENLDDVEDKKESSSTLTVRDELPASNKNTSSSKNDTEDEILGHYNKEFQFTIRDAVRGRFHPNVPCTSLNSHNNGEPCSTGLNGDTLLSTSTSYPDTSFSGNTNIPEKTEKPVIRSTTVEPSTIRVDVKGSNVREESEEEKSLESSTVNNILRSIGPETLKHIEESIERNNSPYQVSLSINKNEDLTTSDDLIVRLISQTERNSSARDKLENIEIVKSMEPEIQATTDVQISTSNKSEDLRGYETEDHPNDFAKNYSFFETEDQNRTRKLDSNASTLSLLQLMAELLKLDRFPRPFAPADSSQVDEGPRSIASTNQYFTTHKDRLQPRTIDSNVYQKPRFEDETTKTPREATTVNSRPLKEQILEQLMENFGQPLYRASRPIIFDLPEVQRSFDFQSGLPISNPEVLQESTSLRTTSRTVVTTTSAPKTTVEPEKTIVKTEFVPSIGFSLDTDEGREEYVEAVLGGLINERTEKGGRKESTTLESVRSSITEENSKTV